MASDEKQLPYLPREIQNLIIEKAVEFFHVEDPLLLLSAHEFKYLLCANPQLTVGGILSNPEDEVQRVPLNVFKQFHLLPGRYQFKRDADYVVLFRDDVPENEAFQAVEDFRLGNIDSRPTGPSYLSDLAGEYFETRNYDVIDMQENEILINLRTLQQLIEQNDIDYCAEEIPTIHEFLNLHPDADILPSEQYYITPQYIYIETSFPSWARSHLLQSIIDNRILVLAKRVYDRDCLSQNYDGSFFKPEDYEECQFKKAFVSYISGGYVKEYHPEILEQLDTYLGLQGEYKRRYNEILNRRILHGRENLLSQLHFDFNRKRLERLRVVDLIDLFQRFGQKEFASLRRPVDVLSPLLSILPLQTQDALNALLPPRS